MLTNVLLALVLSAAIALATGPKLIEWLRGHQMKTSENELGPKEHLKKRGTPIMGGLMIALGCIVSFVLCAAYTGAWVTTILPLLLVSLGSMAVGLADDWTKAVKHRSEGLTPWQKIIGLSVVCLGFSVWCYFTQGSKVLLPFTNTEWDLGLWYIPLLALTVLFMTNSANLQDGIDGILSSVTSVGCMGWAVIAGLSAVTVYQHLNGGSFGIPMVKIPDDPDAARALQDNYSAIAIFAAALCGGCLGFLRYNRYPAKVFMGDTGSTFLGYMLATVSIMGLFKFYAVISFAVPFLILGLPIFDTANAIIRRLAEGRSPMSPDRGHVHHKLIDMGFNQKQAVAILYAISATLGLTAVVLTSSGEVKAVVLLAAVLAAILVGACIIYGAEHWGKHPQEQKKHKNEAAQEEKNKHE